MVTNHISCSILGKEAQVPSTTTKHSASKLLCMYIQVLLCSLVFLWGCFVGYVNFQNSFKDLIRQFWTWCSRTYLICDNFKFNPWKTTQQKNFFGSCPRQINCTLTMLLQLLMFNFICLMWASMFKTNM